MRQPVAQVARALPRLRGLELACRGARRHTRDGARRQPVRCPRSRRWRGALVRGRRAQHRGPRSHRHRRARPRAGRRHRPGLDGAARRRAGHRQVHAAAAGRREPGPDDGSGAVQLGGGVGAPDQVAWRAARRRPGAAVPARRDLPRADPRRARTRPPRPARGRLDPDHLLAQDAIGSRQHRPGARGGHAAAVRGEEPERADLRGRARDQGRHAGRTQGARARRGYGALLRGGAPPLAPRRPRGEEPVRRHQRARRVRDDGGGTASGAQPVGALSGRAARGRAGIGRALLDRGLASPAGRGPGARQCQHVRQRAQDGLGRGSGPSCPAAGRSREACRADSGRRGRVRERCRRHAAGRAGGGF